IIESCHAGSWIQLPSSLTSCENLVLAITTTTSALSAYADVDYESGLTDYNLSDLWVEWTGDFLQSLEYYTSDAHWPEVTSYATTWKIDNLSALYDKCFMRIAALEHTFTERLGIQDPMIYRRYTIVY
ncbi:MAG: C13 family peptidase, partial [Kosmotogaceae bacterium]